MRSCSALSSALLCFLLAAPSWACDMCSIFTALDSRETATGFYGGLFEQFSDFSTLREDGTEVDNPADQSLDSSITQVLLGYQVNHRFGVQLNMPWIDRTFRRPEGEAIERGSETGVGDVTLVAHFRAYEHFLGESALVLNVLGGVKLATGDSDFLAEELTEEHHEGDAGSATSTGKHGGGEHGIASGVHGHDLALGSGSTDFVVGTSGYWGKKRLYLGFNVQYALRTEGDHDYRFANDLTWSLTPSAFLWTSSGRTLAAGVEVFGEKKGKDEQAGETLGDTGIDAIYAGPALTYSHRGRYYADLAVDLPVEQETTELQIVPDYRVRLGLTARF